MNNEHPPKSGPSILSFWRVASMGGETFILFQGGNAVHEFVSSSGTRGMHLTL